MGREAEAEAAVNPTSSEVLARRRVEVSERGETLPRFGLFLFGCGDAADLEALLRRIPAAAASWLSEVVVILEEPSAKPQPLPDTEARRAIQCPVYYHGSPRKRGYGAARKDAFELAIGSGLDFAVTLQGGGVHAPEGLTDLMLAALEHPRQLIVAIPEPGTSGAGPGRALSTFAQRRILGLPLSGFRSGYRVYPVDALERVAFQLAADDDIFELELLVQFRALGAEVREVPLATGFAGAGMGSGNEWRAIATAFGYRLHQLHITMDGRYLVKRDVKYTLKQSATGSHMQIVSIIRSGSRVLDLGCSQGLLAAPLHEKNASLVGVDDREPDSATRALDAYFQRNLENPLELPLGREFDYVIIADVIEHLRNRQQLLRRARRFLKADGRLIISTPNVAIWFYRFSLLAGRFEYGPRGVLDEGHVHLYTGASFRREVERAGFRILNQRVTALPFEVVFESTGRSRLMRRMANFYHAIARLWPSMFAYQHILEAEITTLDDESLH